MRSEVSAKTQQTERPARILYLDQSGKLGGGEVALLPWLAENATGARVGLFSDGLFRQRVEELGIPVELLDAGAVMGVRRESGVGALLGIVPGLLRLRRSVAALAREAEIVYANSQKAFFVAALSKRRGQPLLWHLRDILSPEHFSPLLRRAAVAMGNRYADLVLVNSQATAAAFIAEGGDPRRVRVVYDGVSSLAFEAVTDAQAMLLRAQIAPNARLLLGVFGRLSPWKGQHVVLQALQHLPGVDVVLVGDALFGEESYAEQLSAMAQSAELAGRVHFLGFREDVAAWMKAVDVVVHASTAPEPFGLVIVEGMLAGRPVIATAAGGALEIVTDGVTGLLVQPGSTEEMRAAIARLGADAQLRHELGAAGQSHARSEFSVAAMNRGIRAAIASMRRG